MDTNNRHFAKNVLPVMFGFFIMGFIDLIGISTNYIKAELNISDTILSLISVSCFIWFLILSIPTGFMMNRIGRKNVLLASFLLSALAMIIPVMTGDSFAGYLFAFGFLGIGNTLLQVSVNPLMAEVVAPEKLTGTITLGQFTKAVCSFIAPLIAAACAATAFGWKLIFPIFAFISLLAIVWLKLSPVKNNIIPETGGASFSRTFSLLKDKTILLFFIAILVLVGVDVGINVTFPKLLTERFSMDVANAGIGNSAYFLARTIGAFCGGLILLKINEKRFYLVSILVGIIGLAGLVLAGNPTMAIISVTVFGLGYSNLFGIVFSLALKHAPDMSNEVSSLLVTGVAGGAIVTPILGIITDLAKSQVAAMIVLGIIWIYLFTIIGTVSKSSR